MSLIHIGISGWQYAGWLDEFYPRDLPKRRYLEYATRLLGAIEVNGTFYSLQSPKAFSVWYETSASDAAIAVKGPRYVTHKLRLREPKTALANFFANGLLRLEEKLGPILWQLPPRMVWEPEIFEAFCAMLPADTERASKFARAHDERVSGRVSMAVSECRPLRYAFEIRDDRMMNESMIGMLRRYGHALVIADTAGKHPYAEDLTSDFVYVRLHGGEELYTSGYDETSLQWWASRVRRWAGGEEGDDPVRISQGSPRSRKHRDVFVFFDNDAKVHAPFDALKMQRMLDLPQRLGSSTHADLPIPPRLDPSRILT